MSDGVTDLHRLPVYRVGQFYGYDLSFSRAARLCQWEIAIFAPPTESTPLD